MVGVFDEGKWVPVFDGFSQRDVACPYPLITSFSARVVLLGKVPQVVVVVEVEKLHEVLE